MKSAVFFKDDCVFLQSGNSLAEEQKWRNEDFIFQFLLWNLTVNTKWFAFCFNPKLNSKFYFTFVPGIKKISN
jgi:hypothetical protein